LSNRSQQVTINTESGIVTSQLRKITNGVPQGSILAPLLFVIYTFGFHHIFHNINIQYYADDTQAYKSFKATDILEPINLLNTNLNTLSKKCEKQCLKLNPRKTQAMLFGPKKTCDVICDQIKLNINDNDIETVSQAKDLGVIIHNDLSMCLLSVNVVVVF
jgi:hypothetical protein